jgi:formate dehydrogenase/NADH-quinone oxidoreductase subunit F
MAGGPKAVAALESRLASAGAQIEEVSCLGRCDAAPAACVGHRVVSLDHEESVMAALVDQAPDERPLRAWSEELDAASRRPRAPLATLLKRDAASLIAELETSGLRGMGGAGFPTARKWSLVAAEPATPKHLICNADESEPGTFKDREILHDLPHLVIEGMVLAGRCVGATRGTVFIRHEYEAERLRLEAAIEAARVAGALGKNLHGSGHDFDIDVFVSPGGYILGEETALLECMEDRRGEPRNKPPFPGQRGLHGMPTLINNVETFAHAACILGHGVDWWRGLGVRGHAGHKFLSVSGDVAEPGVVLVPVGTTLGELLERCGGMKDGAPLAAIAPGGASSLFLPADRLDVEIDFDSLAEAGSMLGSGAAIFVAAGRNLLEVGLDVARFFRNESCGKCVPCRVGTEKAVKIVEGETGRLGSDVAGRLVELHRTLERTSICGLGQVALAPLLSILERFPAERDRPGDG